jgi:hypothetical protein
MDPETLIRMVMQFPDQGYPSALIDRMKVIIWADGYFHTRLRPRAGIEKVASTAELGLSDDWPVKHFLGGEKDPVLAWKSNTGSLRLRLGPNPRRGSATGSIAQTYEFSSLRIAQQRLTPKERRLHAVPPRRKDNFVHPRAVRGAELQRRIIEYVAELLRAAREDYVRLIHAVFGKTIPPSLVRVSISEIELAWDVASESGHLLLHAFYEAWTRTLESARRQYVCKGRIKKKARCLGYRSSRGYLAANLGKEYRFKLYALPESVVRFECTLSKRAVKAAAGATWDLCDEHDLQRVLHDCSRHVYPFIVDVQNEVDLRRGAAVIDLAAVFCPGPRGSANREIFRQLFDSGRVHATDESIRRLLRLHAKSEVVVNAGRGYWRLTRRYAKPFKILRRLMHIQLL